MQLKIATVDHRVQSVRGIVNDSRILVLPYVAQFCREYLIDKQDCPSGTVSIDGNIVYSWSCKLNSLQTTYYVTLCDYVTSIMLGSMAL